MPDASHLALRSP